MKICFKRRYGRLSFRGGVGDCKLIYTCMCVATLSPPFPLGKCRWGLSLIFVCSLTTWCVYCMCLPVIWLYGLLSGLNRLSSTWFCLLVFREVRNSFQQHLPSLMASSSRLYNSAAGCNSSIVWIYRSFWSAAGAAREKLKIDISLQKLFCISLKTGLFCIFLPILPYTLIRNEELFQFGVCINTIALSPDPASRALS